MSMRHILDNNMAKQSQLRRFTQPQFEYYAFKRNSLPKNIELCDRSEKASSIPQANWQIIHSFFF